MIFYNSLGKNGRLGNQMFQYAALKGIARKHGYQYAIPPSTVPETHQLRRVFKLSEDVVYETSNLPTVTERSFHFDKDLFEYCPDNVNVNGYLQSYKYFDHIKDEIVKDFTMKKQYDLLQYEYCSIHIRRTDYLGLSSHHPVCDMDYYNAAIEAIGKDIPLVIVSDDINWCKDNINAEWYSDGNDPNKDLHIMMNAKYNIIANSSFSWWGAWLNQNPEKIVVCPKNWFGPAYSHYNMNDLRPEDWIQL